MLSQKTLKESGEHDEEILRKARVTKVKLAHDEAVLGHCKVTEGLGGGESFAGCLETGQILTFGS